AEHVQHETGDRRSSRRRLDLRLHSSVANLGHSGLLVMCALCASESALVRQWPPGGGDGSYSPFAAFCAAFLAASSAFRTLRFFFFLGNRSARQITWPEMCLASLSSHAFRFSSSRTTLRRSF